MEGSRAPAASDFLWARPGAAPPAWRHLPLGAPAQIRPPRHCGPLGPGWGAPWRPRGEGQPMWGDGQAHRDAVGS